MWFRILLGATALVMFIRTVIHFKGQRVNARAFFFWTLVWLGIFVVATDPEITSFVANHAGIGRGADLGVYVALAVLFYLLFRIFVRLEHMERNITKIVRAVALRETNYPRNHPVPDLGLKKNKMDES